MNRGRDPSKPDGGMLFSPGLWVGAWAAVAVPGGSGMGWQREGKMRKARLGHVRLGI